MERGGVCEEPHSSTYATRPKALPRIPTFHLIEDTPGPKVSAVAKRGPRTDRFGR